MHALRSAIVVVGSGGSRFLQRTLERALEFSVPVIYVDMATVDDSTDVARRLKVPVVELDINRPISRARACNKGANYVSKMYPQVEVVQFIRVGCYLDLEWLKVVEAEFDKHPRLGALSGLTYTKNKKGKEFILFAEATRGFLGDLNGGDFAVRLKTLIELRGFDPQPRLGFETEYIVRMQAQKWFSQRIPQRMLDVDPGHLAYFQAIKSSYRQGYIQYYLLFKAPLFRQRAIFFGRSVWVSFWTLWLPIVIAYMWTRFGVRASGLPLLYAILWLGFFIRRRVKINKFESWSRSCLQASKAVVGFWSRLWGHVKAFSDLSTEETAKVFSRKKRKVPRIPG